MPVTASDIKLNISTNISPGTTGLITAAEIASILNDIVTLNEQLQATWDGMNTTGFVPNNRTLTAGTGINAIGDLSNNRTVSLNTTYTDGRYLASPVAFTNFDSISGDKFFNASAATPTNGLGTGQYGGGFQVSAGGNGLYANQLAFAAGGTLHTRTKWNGTWDAWKLILTKENADTLYSPVSIASSSFRRIGALTNITTFPQYGIYSNLIGTTGTPINNAGQTLTFNTSATDSNNGFVLQIWSTERNTNNKIYFRKAQNGLAGWSSWETVATESWSNSNLAPIAHVGSDGTSHAVATTSVAGFMSAVDKTRFNFLSDILKSTYTPPINPDFIPSPKSDLNMHVNSGMVISDPSIGNNPGGYCTVWNVIGNSSNGMQEVGSWMNQFAITTGAEMFVRVKTYSYGNWQSWYQIWTSKQFTLIAASSDSSGNTATASVGVPTKIEFDALLSELRTLKAELRDLKNKMRTSKILAT